MKIEVNKMVRMALLSAMSIVLLLLTRFPIIPSAPFLKYEAADVPIMVGAFMFGPLSGLIITFIVAFLQSVFFDAGSGWVGFVMHVIATGALVLVAGNIYKRFHTFRGAIAALVSGSLAMTAVMIPANLFFTVNFYGMPYDTVVAMILPALLPFNLIKAFGNSVIVLILYKPLSKVIKGFGRKPSGIDDTARTSL